MLAPYILFNVHYVRSYPEYSRSQQCFVIILTAIAKYGFMIQISSAVFALNQVIQRYHKTVQKSEYELHVRPSARKNSVPSGQIFAKFEI